MREGAPTWLRVAVWPGVHLTRAWRPLGAAYFRCLELAYRVLKA